MNPIQQNLIDSYLRNELSGAELSSFESMMESDPTFREEVRFEEYVKEGIGEFRKAQLKTRLNAIEVSPGWVGVVQPGAGLVMKTVGGLITLGVLGTLGYFWMNDEVDIDPEIEGVSELALESPTTEPKQAEVYELPSIVDEAKKAEPEVSREKKEIAVEKEVLKIEDQSAPVKLDDAAQTITRELKEDNELKHEEFVPQVTVPGLNEMDAEEVVAVTDVEIPEASSTDMISAPLTPLDVKTINRRSESIRYKFFEGKLYLYGDFKKEPYEILEINGTDDRKIYVFFDSKYYQVQSTDKVEDLPEVTNSKLISELEILRNNKVSE